MGVLKSRLLRLLLWTAAALGVLWVLAWFGVPALLKWQLESRGSQALGLITARVMLNQVDTLSDPTMADRFEAALGRSLIASSLK